MALQTFTMRLTKKDQMQLSFIKGWMEDQIGNGTVIPPQMAMRYGLNTAYNNIDGTKTQLLREVIDNELNNR